MKDVLTLKEAALYLGVCSKTLAKYARSGQIPCRRIGKVYLFSRLALIDWLTKISDSPCGGYGQSQKGETNAYTR